MNDPAKTECVLTVEIARRFLAGEDIDLELYTQIDADAARLVCNHQGDLNLFGLTNCHQTWRRVS